MRAVAVILTRSAADRHFGDARRRVPRDPGRA